MAVWLEASMVKPHPLHMRATKTLDCRGVPRKEYANVRDVGTARVLVGMIPDRRAVVSAAPNAGDLQTSAAR